VMYSIEWGSAICCRKDWPPPPCFPFGNSFMSSHLSHLYLRPRSR
jgi:hypothetical protein